MRGKFRYKSMHTACSKDSLFIRMEYSWVGMNIEIIVLPYIFPKKIEGVIIILLVNRVEVNQYLSAILRDKIFGVVMDFVLSILMVILSKTLFRLRQKNEQKI